MTIQRRFFIDHGVVHDRATGRHLTQDIEDDYPQHLCDLLNDLQAEKDGYREALTVLVELKQIKRRIERGKANDSMLRYYEASKDAAWNGAEAMLTKTHDIGALK